MMRDAIIWPDNGPLQSGMIQEALTIFSFDGLTQNVDRRHDNPNLMTREDKLCVIDHECAFSFISAIVPTNTPWDLGPGDYMERHPLRHALKGQALDWSSCRQRLEIMTPAFFDEIEGEFPDEWSRVLDMPAIRQHVASVLEHVDLFQAELRRRIA
jgi:hypothetical protein